MRTIVSDGCRETKTVQANTEVGMLLLIDLSALFTEKEWNKINHDDTTNESYFRAIKEKFPEAYHFSIIDSLGGDGIYRFNQMEETQE